MSMNKTILDIKTILRGRIAPTHNGTCKKLAVQWLKEALNPARAGCSAGRQFSSPKSPTSLSCKTLATIRK